ncbi:MAG: hypothetical protein ACR650_16810 [Methylocystis sp.]
MTANHAPQGFLILRSALARVSKEEATVARRLVKRSKMVSPL